VYEGFSTRETWPFECCRCLMIWEEEYIVRHLTDTHGNEVDVWFRAELHVQPPWTDARCPGCGAGGVKTFPRGYLSRHPELGRPVPGFPAASVPAAAYDAPAVEAGYETPAAAAYEAPMAEPAPPVLVLGRRSPAFWLRRPGLVYAAIGISVLLFASLELLEILRAAHRVH
jgi:hypothetical protein